MIEAKDVYVHCDKLDSIPAPNKDNWLFELNYLVKKLPMHARVLQVGSADGVRIISLLAKRPDLVITGMEIDENLTTIAKQKLADAGQNAHFIHDDVVTAHLETTFDYILCLNNTLGYISQDTKAIENMKRFGSTVILGVYAEQFNDELAKLYFTSLGLQIEKIEDNVMTTKDFCSIKRYSLDEIKRWGGEHIETPIGYLVII